MEEKNNIEELNKKVDTSNNNKSKYIKLKRELEEICIFLSDGKDYIDDAVCQLKNNYKLDDESADQGKLYNLSCDVQETINYIKSYLIPSINSQIDNINNNIASIKEIIETGESEK